MVSIREYRRAESLEEAWELNQVRGNRIIGGMLWTKMGRGRIRTAIDLSGLGLDEIEETDEEFRIGCMVTLRQLEQSEALEQYSQGAVRRALGPIVGVQFRNLATVGGSIFGRFGFSDVLTLFLAMDSYVELYRGGIVPLREFARQKRDRDILVRLIVRRRPWSFAYQSVRGTATDFAILTCAGALADGRFRVAVGARPGRAVLFEGEPQAEGILCAESFARQVEAAVETGSNMRGSAAYRRHLAGVLTRRVCEELGGAEK